LFLSAPGLYGTCISEEYYVDMAQDGLIDAGRDWAPLFGSDEEAKKTYFAEKAPPNLEKLEKVVAKHGGPFILGNTFSFVDLGYFVYYERHLNGVPDIKSKYPHLGALHKAVQARPNIAAYLASDRLPK